MSTEFERLIASVMAKARASGGMPDPDITESLNILRAYQGVEWLDISEDADLPANVKTILGKGSAIAGQGSTGTKKAVLVGEPPFRTGRVYMPKVRLAPNLVIMGNDITQPPLQPNLSGLQFVTNFGQQVRYKTWLYTVIFGWTTSARGASRNFIMPIVHRMMTNIPDPSNVYSSPGTNEGIVAGIILRSESVAASKYFINSIDVSGSTTPVTQSRGIFLPRGWEMAVEFMADGSQYYDIAMVFEVIG